MLTEATKVDRRVRRTKKLLKIAFVKLMQEKDYHRITVKDIVERADYNRATFYLHYQFKEQLVDEILEEMVNELIITIPWTYDKTLCRTSPHPNLTLFDHILENKDYFKLLKNTSKIPGFIEKFMCTINNKMTVEGTQIKSDSFVSFISYGILGIIVDWIKSDFADSPRNLSKQLSSILYAVYQTDI
jgi:AcrR family transcriptional regulator